MLFRHDSLFVSSISAMLAITKQFVVIGGSSYWSLLETKLPQNINPCQTVLNYEHLGRIKKLFLSSVISKPVV